MDQPVTAAAGDSATAGAATRERRRVPIASTADYEEIFCLGAGAFGEVVKARHRATGEVVAIKRLRSADGRNNAGNGGLLREARFLDACCTGGHPSLVGYRGLARDRATGELSLVMEFVGPSSLRDYLRDRRLRGSPPLPEETVRAAMRQLLEGAQSMHAKLVAHRDIKPANVLVADDHRALKICDLGLAVSMAEPPPYAQAGTLPYTAPEVLQGKTDYSTLVDAWSLGCVMAELVAGKPLFDDGCDEMGQLYEIFHLLVPDGDGEDNLLRKKFPEKTLSEEGFEVLSGLLAYAPEQRLSADAALKLPWFAKVTELALPTKQEDELAIAMWVMHRRKKRLPSAPPPLPKILLRRKLGRGGLIERNVA
ncbi:hypothetical protein ACP4OV_020075 [Aristida adscensionis]